MSIPNLNELDQTSFIGATRSGKHSTPNAIRFVCPFCGVLQTISVKSNFRLSEKDHCFAVTRPCQSCGGNVKFFFSLSLEPNEDGFPTNKCYIEGDNTFFSNEFGLKEMEKKAAERLRNGDYTGSLAATNTLFEKFLKHKLLYKNQDFDKTEGNLKKLANQLLKTLNNEEGNISEPTKRMTSSMINFADSLYQLANKSSDRHHALEEVDHITARTAYTITMEFCRFLNARL